MPDQIPEQITSMAALEAKAQVQNYKYPPKPLARLDADVRVTYTGVCASDVHMINNDWECLATRWSRATKWLAM